MAVTMQVPCSVMRFIPSLKRVVAHHDFGTVDSDFLVVTNFDNVSQISLFNLLPQPILAVVAFDEGDLTVQALDQLDDLC